MVEIKTKDMDGVLLEMSLNVMEKWRKEVENGTITLP